MSFPTDVTATSDSARSDASEIIDVNSVAKMSGPEFERLVARLFEKMGFKVTSTKASGDGGIDLVAECEIPLLQGKYVIQCKRYEGSVGEPFVRDLYGVMMAERANKGVLVTNSAFTPSAKAFAAGKPLELIDGPKLFELLSNNQLATVGQISRSFEYDPEIVRLRRVVEALPDDLGWRVQLAQYALGVVQSPRDIASRKALMPYVEEAELQLWAVNEISQRRCTAVHEGSARKKELAFGFVEHSSALWIAWLQLAQGKAADAIKWMSGIRTGIYSDGCFEAPEHPEILNRFYVANAINVANIAAFCGKPKMKEMIFDRYSERIQRFVLERKGSLQSLLRSHGGDPGTVNYALDGLKRLERIRDDADLLFSSSLIVRDFESLERHPNLVPYKEIEMRLFGMGSISQTVAPGHGILLSAGEVPMQRQGDAVEEEIVKLLKNLEAAEAQGRGWRARCEIQKQDRITILNGPFEKYEGVVDEILWEKGAARVNLMAFGRVTPINFEFWQIAKLGES